MIERASEAARIISRNPNRFQGQQFDEETGLAYNRMRFYDSACGQFMSHGPIARFKRYTKSFCRGAPMR
jgi:RHS repeat-associated protein